MIDRTERRHRIFPGRYHRKHRVFHSADCPRHRRRLRIWIWKESLRVVPDRPLGLLSAGLPRFSGFRPFVIRLRQHAIPAGSIPSEIGRSRPRHVSDFFSVKSPRLGSRRQSPPNLVDANDRDHRFSLGGSFQSCPLSRSEHIQWILQNAGCSNGITRGNSYRKIDVAVFQIEFALSEIRVRVPAYHIVIYRHARIPLRNFVQCTVSPHPIRAMIGHAKFEFHPNFSGRPGMKRVR